MLFPEPKLDHVWSRQLGRTADLWMTSRLSVQDSSSTSRLIPTVWLLPGSLEEETQQPVPRPRWLPAPGLAFPWVRASSGLWDHPSTPTHHCALWEAPPKLLLESWFYGSRIFNSESKMRYEPPSQVIQEVALEVKAALGSWDLVVASADGLGASQRWWRLPWRYSAFHSTCFMSPLGNSLISVLRNDFVSSN